MGNVTVITGATSGIGRAIAEKILMHASGDDLLIASYAHDDGKAAAWKASMGEAGEKIVLHKVDLSSYEDMMEFAAFIKETTDHVDWLISNAGITSYKKYEDYTFEEWNRILNTNVSVPVFFIKELRPMMREGGRLVLMGSYAGEQAYSSSLVYGVSKAAVLFMARALVKEFEPKGITVNAIAPGFIETPWQANRTQESYDRINKKIALHRFGTAQEVADVAWCILNNAYMNGSIVDIHGGYDYF